MASPSFPSPLAALRSWWLPGLALALLVAIPWLIMSWANADRQLSKKQAEFLEALGSRKASAIEGLLSKDYHDQWGFDRVQAAAAMQDATSHFIALAVQPIDPVATRSGREATVRQRLQISGSGTPLAGEVIRQVNRLKEPFVFTWKRESVWPSSWRLVRIEHPSLDVPADYEPGMIRGLLSDP